MPSAQPPLLHISEPAEIAQVIPYLVGFTPENSLVVSALQGKRIQVTARVNLDEVQPTGGVELLLERIWNRYPDANGMAVAYTDDHLAGWDVLSRCDAWLSHGCVTMLVDGDTWQTADGITGTIDPHGELATQVAGHGLRTLPTRADLAARFDRQPNIDELDRNLGEALAGLPEARDTAAILQLTTTLIDRNLPTDPNRPNDLSPVDAIQAIDLPDLRPSTGHRATHHGAHHHRRRHSREHPIHLRLGWRHHQRQSHPAVWGGRQPVLHLRRATPTESSLDGRSNRYLRHHPDPEHARIRTVAVLVDLDHRHHRQNQQPHGQDGNHSRNHGLHLPGQ